MAKLTLVLTGLTCFILLLVVIRICKDDVSRSYYSVKVEKLLQQRNRLSKLLNEKQQEIGQLQCEKIDIRETSDSGGWCKNASSDIFGSQHFTDTKLAEALAEFFKGKFIGSFGDGPGRYKQILLRSNKIKGYHAYDGAPFCDIVSDGRVQFLDLTLPQYNLPLYDWILSLEVAEHIYKKFENVFIDNVVRHAREGVVLSWAKIGQGGFQHVNNQPFEYVKNLMDNLGFYHDEAESKKLKDAASLPWFQWNTNVYRRRKPISIDKYIT